VSVVGYGIAAGGKASWSDFGPIRQETVRLSDALDWFPGPAEREGIAAALDGGLASDAVALTQPDIAERVAELDGRIRDLDEGSPLPGLGDEVEDIVEDAERLVADAEAALLRLSQASAPDAGLIARAAALHRAAAELHERAREIQQGFPF
jgi:hypothetical protein